MPEMILQCAKNPHPLSSPHPYASFPLPPQTEPLPPKQLLSYRFHSTTNHRCVHAAAASPHNQSLVTRILVKHLNLGSQFGYQGPGGETNLTVLLILLHDLILLSQQVVSNLVQQALSLLGGQILQRSRGCASIHGHVPGTRVFCWGLGLHGFFFLGSQPLLLELLGGFSVEERAY